MNITNDLVTNFIHSFYKPLNSDFRELREYAETNNIPIILKETEMFLKSVLELKNPKTILEIGTAIGYSAMFFSTVCPNAKIYSIEKNKKMYDEAVENIHKFNMRDKITVIHGDGEEETSKLIEDNPSKFDLVFLDGAKSQNKRFLKAALPNCQEGTLIITDNILYHGMTVSTLYDKNMKHQTSVRNLNSYLENIFNRDDLSTSIISSGDGLALSIYRGLNE